MRKPSPRCWSLLMQEAKLTYQKPVSYREYYREYCMGGMGGMGGMCLPYLAGNTGTTTSYWGFLTLPFLRKLLFLLQPSIFTPSKWQIWIRVFQSHCATFFMKGTILGWKLEISMFFTAYQHLQMFLCFKKQTNKCYFFMLNFTIFFFVVNV